MKRQFPYMQFMQTIFRKLNVIQFHFDTYSLLTKTILQLQEYLKIQKQFPHMQFI